MNTNKDKVLHKELAYQIVGCAMRVHSTLGYGFLEKVYENALMILLEQEGINAVQQAPISVYFEEQIVGEYFADILIDEKIIVEIKAAEKIIPAHEAQALNYLKATKLRLALILNFGKEKLEQERLVI